MNSDPPNAMQKSWREFVRLDGSIISGPKPIKQIEIHHPCGRRGKQSHLDIGHWFVLPVTQAEHRMIHAHELEELKDRWLVGHLFADWWDLDNIESTHEFERFLFDEICKNKTVLPFDNDIREAIQSWRR